MPLLLALWLLAAGPQVTAYPSVVNPGGSVRVTCRIPRRPENRKVKFGLDGRLSVIDLAGDDSPSAFFKTIDRVDQCPPIAVCQLIDNMGKTLTDRKTLLMPGCNDSAE